MEKKLNILSATLVGLCVLTGSVMYSLIRSHHDFSDFSCEANATFNYFNSLDAQAAHNDIQKNHKNKKYQNNWQITAPPAAAEKSRKFSALNSLIFTAGIKRRSL
ncbi:hypothetical protein ACTVM4_01515 [Serratia ureilytica]|uniref:hypothetical protein n=1 Tax=Serratia ureilytica TaxID=300181 RepID=UPI003FA68AA2